MLSCFWGIVHNVCIAPLPCTAVSSVAVTCGQATGVPLPHQPLLLHPAGAATGSIHSTAPAHCILTYGLVCTCAGAHTGRGLGRNFLRHLRRTRALLHVVDASAADSATDYYAGRVGCGQERAEDGAGHTEPA